MSQPVNYEQFEAVENSVDQATGSVLILASAIGFLLGITSRILGGERMLSGHLDGLDKAAAQLGAPTEHVRRGAVSAATMIRTSAEQALRGSEASGCNESLSDMISEGFTKLTAGASHTLKNHLELQALSHSVAVLMANDALRTRRPAAEVETILAPLRDFQQFLMSHDEAADQDFIRAYETVISNLRQLATQNLKARP